jgi:hypothetical protein
MGLNVWPLKTVGSNTGFKKEQFELFERNILL